MVCRQRPLTARGIIFPLPEDEFGLVNVLVRRALDAADPVTVRTVIAETLEPLRPAAAFVAPEGKSWG